MHELDINLSTISLNLPAKKSHTFNAIIIASLANGISELFNLLIDHDTKLLIEHLQHLGIVIQLDEVENSCIIAGCNGSLPKKQLNINCKSRKVLHYLLLLCATSAGFYFFQSPSNKLKFDKTLLKFLHHEDIQMIPQNMKTTPISLVGHPKLHGGDFSFDKKYSQLAAHLLLVISPLANRTTSLNFPDKNYDIHSVITMMAAFGILVREYSESKYIIPAPQSYKARDFKLQGDLYQFMLYICAMLITRKTFILTNVQIHHNKRFLNYFKNLRQLGYEILKNENGYLFKQAPKDIPILIEITSLCKLSLSLILLSLFRVNVTTIKCLNFRKKSLKRFYMLLSIFDHFSIEYQLDGFKLSIFPHANYQGLVDISSYQDNAIIHFLFAFANTTNGVRFTDETLFICWQTKLKHQLKPSNEPALL